MNMKKIIIIDGGPRKTFNTASMLQKIAEGAASVSDQIEVKTIRLYDMQYRGCMSCMACKLKDRVSNVCKYKDALTPVLEAEATPTPCLSVMYMTTENCTSTVP